MPGSWLTRRAPRPAAPVRLYCFPHAGGAAGEYALWADGLPSVEVHAIQLPGRGARLEEDPLTDVLAVRDAVVDAVAFRAPFVLFGHSLGALIAFEVARALDQRGAPPACLLVSAARAPHAPPRTEPISHLGDAALLEQLARGGDAAVRELIDDPELQELALPALRADLRMAERYRFAAGPPLRCPIAALGGAGDDLGEAELAAWERHTSAAFSLHLFDGGHFYTRTTTAAVLPLIARIAQGACT